MRGVVVDDPTYVKDDVAHFKDDTDELGLTLDPSSTSMPRSHRPDGPTADLAGTPPTDGTPVEISGSRLVDYWPICSNDANGDGTCTDAEADGFDVIVYDPVGKRAMTVLTRTSPAFTDATMTGMLTRNEQAVDEAQGSGPIDVGEHQLEVSRSLPARRWRDPAGSPLAFLLAAVLALLGGVILVGVRGGYLVYHRHAGPLPEPRSTHGSRRTPAAQGHGFHPHAVWTAPRPRGAGGPLVRFILRPAAPAFLHRRPGRRPAGDRLPRRSA